MNDHDNVWIEPKTATQTTSSSTSSTPFFVLLFVVLIAIALPVVYFLPRLNPNTQPVATRVDVPEVLSNCAFFYQLCPTSSAGVVTIQTVDQKLSELNSPLQQSGLLLFSELDREQSSLSSASQVVTLTAAKYNINPFLLLTLAEMNNHLVTQPIELRPTVEAAGEHSGDAWFSVQLQSLAAELQTLSQAAQLAPNTLTEKSHLTSVKIGTQTMKISGNFSLSTQVVVEYLAKNSTSIDDLQTKLTTFSDTYQQLWGINPAESTK